MRLVIVLVLAWPKHGKKTAHHTYLQAGLQVLGLMIPMPLSLVAAGPGHGVLSGPKGSLNDSLSSFARRSLAPM